MAYGQTAARQTSLTDHSSVGVTLVTIADSGHMSNVEQPEQFNRAVSRLLERAHWWSGARRSIRFHWPPAGLLPGSAPAPRASAELLKSAEVKRIFLGDLAL
jgi:hypothetical protein